MYTVKDLKEVLNGLPDETRVYIRDTDWGTCPLVVAEILVGVPHEPDSEEAWADMDKLGPKHKTHKNAKTFLSLGVA